MKLREIPIPTGCTRVSVEQENDKIVILFEGNNKEFVLDLTGETESPPEIGDLAIFWNAGKEYLAVIALWQTRNGCRNLRSTLIRQVMKSGIATQSDSVISLNL